MRDRLIDLALPRTDAGALVQIVIMAAVWTVVVVWSLRWRREYQTFVIGLAVVNFAWFGARMIH